MSKRELALTNARVAGYNNDKATFTRLVIESRVSITLLNQAWQLGQKQKEEGIL